MRDLSSASGIGTERTALYNGLMDGTVDASKAAIAERILTGQVDLKVKLPLTFFNMVSRMKVAGAEDAQRQVIAHIQANLSMGPAQLAAPA